MESSTEEWQREARRLEQHGKAEQAEAIRSTVLCTTAVPWTVLDAEGVTTLAAKALDARVNHVLARSEVASTYSASRKLWVRTRLGHYMPNPDLSLRVTQADGTETWKPVLDVLKVDWIESFVAGG